jgi:hypothetical protein
MVKIGKILLPTSSSKINKINTAGFEKRQVTFFKQVGAQFTNILPYGYTLLTI